MLQTIASLIGGLSYIEPNVCMCLAHQVHCHRLQRAVIDHLKLLRGGEPAEMLVFRKRSPARRYLDIYKYVGVRNYTGRTRINVPVSAATRE